MKCIQLSQKWLGNLSLHNSSTSLYYKVSKRIIKLLLLKYEALAQLERKGLLKYKPGKGTVHLGTYFSFVFLMGHYDIKSCGERNHFKEN